jgi:hypothetical protein
MENKRSGQSRVDICRTGKQIQTSTVVVLMKTMKKKKKKKKK